MKTIFKYPLTIGPIQSVAMPAGAQLLTIQEQRGVPTLWAFVDPDKPVDLRYLAMYGTGHSMPHNPGKYVGTAQIDQLVWHFFEEPHR